MIRKGIVSSVNSAAGTARVTFRDMGDTVTAELPIAAGVSVEVGRWVAVAFFSDGLADGLIIAAYREV